MENFIDGVEILSVEVSFDCNVNRNDYDLGSLRLSCEGRDFVLDVAQSYTENGDKTTIVCDLEVDLETFPKGEAEYESKYDLKAVDFLNPNLVATLYVGYEDGAEEGPEFITLWVKIGGITKAINVIQD